MYLKISTGISWKSTGILFHDLLDTLICQFRKWNGDICRRITGMMKLHIIVLTVAVNNTGDIPCKLSQGSSR